MDKDKSKLSLFYSIAVFVYIQGTNESRRKGEEVQTRFPEQVITTKWMASILIDIPWGTNKWNSLYLHPLILLLRQHILSLSVFLKVSVSQLIALNFIAAINHWFSCKLLDAHTFPLDGPLLVLFSRDDAGGASVNWEVRDGRTIERWMDVCMDYSTTTTTIHHHFTVKYGVSFFRVSASRLLFHCIPPPAHSFIVSTSGRGAR